MGIKDNIIYGLSDLISPSPGGNIQLVIEHVNLIL